MQISVIIACFNAADTIVAQLNALANQCWSEPWEIIVSDNGSTDESVAVVEQCKERIPNLRLIDSSDRRGQAHARNVGAQAANGEALIFCDADDEVAPGWLAAMGKALSNHDFVACRRDYKKLNESWVRGCYGGGEGEGIGPFSFLPLASGGTIGLKRTVHEAVSGFDETIRFLEDVDYCWRIYETGTKLHYVPDAVVNFRLRNTLGGMYRRAWNHAEYQGLLYQKYQTWGMPKPISVESLIKALVRLSLKLVLLRVYNRESLGRWLLDYAWHVGNLQGCIKYRYLPSRLSRKQTPVSQPSAL